MVHGKDSPAARTARRGGKAPLLRKRDRCRKPYSSENDAFTNRGATRFLFLAPEPASREKRGSS
jgi:hypothetical protein